MKFNDNYLNALRKLRCRHCHAERSEASRCPSRETLRGVYPERSEGLRVTTHCRS